MSFSASDFLEFPPSVWSLRWYRNFFSSQEWLDAAGTSLQLARWTAAVATPMGTAAAYGLRSRQGALDGLIRLTFLYLIDSSLRL